MGCSVLQCVAACVANDLLFMTLLPSAAVYCSVLLRVAVFCSVLHCVLQCVAVRIHITHKNEEFKNIIML